MGRGRTVPDAPGGHPPGPLSRPWTSLVPSVLRHGLDGTERAAGLIEAGAARVTVIADSESDIYEEFVHRPAGVDVLIRAGQDRALSDGTRLFAKAASLPEAGRMTVELPAAPGRKARTATLVPRFTEVEIARPISRKQRGERDGTAKRPLDDAFDPDDRPLLEAISASLEGKTERQKNPHPKGSLAFATWVFARLGGWTGYYGKPGIIYNGLIATTPSSTDGTSEMCECRRA